MKAVEVILIAMDQGTMDILMKSGQTRGLMSIVNNQSPLAETGESEHSLLE